MSHRSCACIAIVLLFAYCGCTPLRGPFDPITEEDAARITGSASEQELLTCDLLKKVRADGRQSGRTPSDYVASCYATSWTEGYEGLMVDKGKVLAFGWLSYREAPPGMRVREVTSSECRLSDARGLLEQGRAFRYVPNMSRGMTLVLYSYSRGQIKAAPGWSVSPRWLLLMAQGIDVDWYDGQVAPLRVPEGMQSALPFAKWFLRFHTIVCRALWREELSAILRNVNSSDPEERFSSDLMNEVLLTTRYVLVPELTGALRDSRSFVRLRAAKAIVRVGPLAKAAAPSLVVALGDANTQIRKGAQDALYKIGPAGVPALAEGAQSKSVTVRINACQTLGRIGPEAKEATQALRSVQEDTDPAVRRAATEALEAISAPRGESDGGAGDQ